MRVKRADDWHTVGSGQCLALPSLLSLRGSSGATSDELVVVPNQHQLLLSLKREHV